MMKLHARSLVSKVFYGFGALAVVAGFFAFITGFVDSSSGVSGAAGYVIGGICLLSAVLFAGLGEVLHLLARVIKITERAASMLAAQASAMSVPNTNTDSLASAQKFVTPTATEGYFYEVDGKQEGPFTVAEMRRFREQGTVTDTTEVFRTGDKEWRALSRFPDLMVR